MAFSFKNGKGEANNLEDKGGVYIGDRESIGRENAKVRMSCI